MAKIPTYIQCLAKFVSFFGIDYDEETGKTKDFKIGERNDFSKQKEHYAEYNPKILNLLAGDDEVKRCFIETCLDVSENIARELTSKNYYTLASNKRIMSALLVFYYIPHVACLIAFYKKEFGIPDCLDGFMPLRNEKNKIISPTDKLRHYLKEIKKEISEKYDNENNPLTEEYLESLRNNTVPGYKKHDEIIKFLKTIPTFNTRIDEIDLVIRTAIVSGHIYKELLSIFDEDYVISLMDYFKQFLTTSERLFKDTSDIKSNFEGDVELYVHYYNNLFLYSIATRKFIELSIEHNSQSLGFDEFIEAKVFAEQKVFENFYDFINLAVSETTDTIFKIDNENLDTVGFWGIQKELIKNVDDFSKERALLVELSYLLEDIDDTFADSEFLEETTIQTLLQELQNHPLYKVCECEHEFLYYDSLNDLAKNDFASALEKIELAAEHCEKITAGETQLKIAEKFIVLKLLNNPNETSFSSHLNQAIKAMIDAQRQEMSILYISDYEIEKPIAIKGKGDKLKTEENPILKLDYKGQEKLYLSNVLKIMAKFNAEGYARYENVDCVKYNPFEKLEKFMNDFYDAYESDTKTYESDKIKIRKIIKKLTAKHKNLVTLCQYKVKDVFDSVDLEEFWLFLYHSKIESKNIYKMTRDIKMRELIYESLST